MQNAGMPNVTIRDLPPDVHAVLARRAAASGRSLQQFLVHVLRKEASTLSTDEWLAQIEQRLPATADPARSTGADVVELIQEEREERDARLLGR